MTENNTGKNSIFPQNLAKALDIKCSIRAKFAASQPRSLAAEGKLCPNKFTIKHKQTYSHKKPQGTQRIIKECLTKPLLKHLASLACLAVKLKNIRRVIL